MFHITETAFGQYFTGRENGTYEYKNRNNGK